MFIIIFFYLIFVAIPCYGTNAFVVLVWYIYIFFFLLFINQKSFYLIVYFNSFLISKFGFMSQDGFFYQIWVCQQQVYSNYEECPFNKKNHGGDYFKIRPVLIMARLFVYNTELVLLLTFVVESNQYFFLDIFVSILYL